jgi:hypothetical protein
MAGFAHAGHGTLDLVLNLIGIDQAGKAAIFAVVIPHPVPDMRAGRDQHRAVFEVAVVQQDANREDVVIGVRVERPILVPFHRRAVLRRLHVQLGAVEAQAGTQELCEDFDHRAAAYDLVKDRMNLVRGLDAADTGDFRCVAGLEVVDVGVFRDLCGTSHQFGDDIAHPLKRVGVEHLGHDNHAVPLIGLHHALRNHLSSFVISSYVSATI